MPVLLIVILLAEVLTIGFIVGDIWLWREWWEYRNTLYDDYASRCLYGAIALLAYSFLGKSLIKALLSKKRPGEDEPEMFAAPRRDQLKRPDGSIIHIEYYGKESGQPIIFVHGWNANIREWYYQRTFFEKDYRLIMIDLPGLGKSTRPSNKDFSLAKMARDLNNVIDYTGARNPILWGHSIGGMIILNLLAKHRESLIEPVKAIILQHTTYTNPVKTIIFSRIMTALQKPVLVPLCYVLIALSPIIWLSRWMSYLNGNSHLFTRFLTFTGTQTPKQLDFITLLSTMAPPAVTARGVLGMFRYDVTPELSSIQVPALILAANKDRLTKAVASRFMHEHIPNSELVLLEPAGHQGLVERHRESNEAALRFIQRVTEQKKDARPQTWAGREVDS